VGPVELGRARGPAAQLALTRSWLRGALRRPVRAVAVVAGLAVMSVATVGSLVAGDALDQLFLADAAAEWGAVDLEARAADDAVHELSTGRLLGVEGAPAIRAAAPRLLLQAVVAAAPADGADEAGAGGEEGEGAGVPGVGLLGLGAEEQGFPPLEAVAGTADVLRLAPDEVVVNERLARRLGLAVGDDVAVTAAVPRWLEDVATQGDPIVHPPFALRLELTVAGIAADRGTADLHRTPNAMVRRDVLARAAGLDGRVTVTHLRVAGSGPAAAEAGVDALAHLALALDLDVDPVLADQLALAEEEGGLFRSILLTLSALVVAAAVVATVGLLVTLGEERAPEVAVLRALGWRRRAAARPLVVEAAAYGILGAAVGALLGIPFARLVAGLLADHFAALGRSRGREQVALDVGVETATVATGVALVALVAVLAGRSAARQVLSAPIEDVLRGAALRVPPPDPSPRRPLLLALCGAALVGAGAVAGGGLVFIGATALLGAWWSAARRRTADADRLDRRAAVAGIAWAVLAAPVLGGFADGVQAGFGVLVVAGFAAIVCGTVLAVPRLDAIGRVLRTWLPLGSAQVALRTAALQARQARRRSATTVVVVGGVLFMVAALSVLGSAQALPVERQSGGYDVVARSIAPLDARALQRLPEVGAVATAPESLLPETAFTTEGPDGAARTVPYPIRIAAATTGLASTQAFGLATAVPGTGSAADALGGLVRERGRVVLDRAALPEGARVGDDVVIDIGSAPRRLRLVAVLDTFLLATAFVNEADLAQVAELRGPTLALVRAADGTTPAALVAALERHGRDGGLTADALTDVRADVIAVNRTFTDTFAVMLLLGLAVAVTSVGAYVVRAARERRTELAVLRALGLRRGATAALLAAEPVLTGVVGVAVGLSVGLGILRLLFAVGFSDLAFVVSWGRVGLVAGATVALLVLVCGAAARLSLRGDVAAGLRDLG
jgi:putative ABC transport system permease protein